MNVEGMKKLKVLNLAFEKIDNSNSFNIVFSDTSYETSCYVNNPFMLVPSEAVLVIAGL